MKRARVAWRYRSTGYEGHGSYVDHATAVEEVESLNEGWSGMKTLHWLEEEPEDKLSPTVKREIEQILQGLFP